MNLHQAFETVLVPSEVAAIGRAFDLMGVAEEEISAAYARYPRRSRAAVRGSFRVLCPSPVLRERGDRLYRAHVREMIDRCVQGQDARLATDAEVLAGFLGASLVAPLQGNAQAAAETLFARLFPEQADYVIGEHGARELWAGAVEEAIELARCKLRQEDRR